MRSKTVQKILYEGGAIAAIVCSALIIAFLASRTAQGLPLYAQRTGLPYGQCHINPQRGGPRTAFGRAFAANGHRLPGKTQKRYRHQGDYWHGPGMMGGRSGMMGGGGMMGGYGR